MHRVGIARVGGSGDTGSDVCLAKVALESGVGEIVVGRRVAWGEKIGGPARGVRGVGEVAGVITMGSC